MITTKEEQYKWHEYQKYGAITDYSLYIYTVV